MKLSRRGRAAIGYGLLAALAYIPPLLTAPGKVAADTKQYLYLDPGRLMTRAASMWDPNVAMGTVTHQTIGYLFPMGPFFALGRVLGVSDSAHASVAASVAAALNRRVAGYLLVATVGPQVPMRSRRPRHRRSRHPGAGTIASSVFDNTRSVRTCGAPVLGGRHTGPALERTVERAWVGEAEREGDLGDAEA